MTKKTKKKKIVKKQIVAPVEIREKIKLGTRDIFDTCLAFERPVVEMEKKINELRKINHEGIDLSGEIKSAEKKLEKAIQDIFDHLTPWQRVQVARHPLRPYTLDYVSFLTTDFLELHGDRRFSDDRAIVTGIAKWGGKEPVCIIGHQKRPRYQRKSDAEFRERPSGRLSQSHARDDPGGEA